VLSISRADHSTEGFAPGAEIVVSVIGGEDEEIKVRVGICCALGIGADETGNEHALVSLASCEKAVKDDSVVRRQLYFLGIHCVVTPIGYSLLYIALRSTGKD